MGQTKTKMAQDSPNVAQDGPKSAPESPKVAQDGPRKPQEGPKTAREGSKMASKRVQDDPRWPNIREHVISLGRKGPTSEMLKKPRENQ